MRRTARTLFFSSLLVATSGLLLACGDSSGGGGFGGTDGEGDGGTDASAPVGPFCVSEPAHKLCADFDNGAVDQGFTSTDFRNGGAVAIATDNALSPPNVAAATAAGGVDARGYLVKSFPGPAVSVHVAFQFRAEQVGDDGSGATILVVQASPNHTVTLNVGKLVGMDSVGCGMSEFGTSSSQLSTVDGKSGWGLHEWVHLDVTVTYAPPIGHIVVLLNHGAAPLIDAPLAPPDVTGDYAVSLGIRPYAGTGDDRVLFDNVAMD